MGSWMRYGAVAAVAMACAMGSSASQAAEYQLWTWGANERGQLGNATNKKNGTPTLITDGVTAIAAGLQFTIVAKNNEIWACGDNLYRQLGYETPLESDYSTTLQKVPIQDTLIRSVAAGPKSSFAINNNGSWWAWGYNGDGLLGLGHTSTPVSSPEPHPFSGVKTIVGGINHCMALTDNGEVWSWGNRSDHGQLGREPSSITTPGQIELGTNVIAIAAGDHHGLALTNNNEVWSWGRNNLEQLGRDTGGSSDQTPTLVTGLIGTITAIAAVGNENLAVVDGYVWGWGENSQAPNELFDRNAFPELANIQDVAIGFRSDFDTNTFRLVNYYSYFALTDSGDLYAWGDNFHGQLGLGEIGTVGDSYSTPQFVGSHFMAISTNGSHVLALRNFSVPEPGSLGLLTLGLAYLLPRRRKH
ncbi:MAG: PEP-CTERM sorting domain-containing protein [Phycisphaerales bacterium]|nr:PEP-CTERM sorting domain-containing protein [Phycisphaerales bacterium]